MERTLILLRYNEIGLFGLKSFQIIENDVVQFLRLVKWPDLLSRLNI